VKEDIGKGYHITGNNLPVDRINAGIQWKREKVEKHQGNGKDIKRDMRMMGRRTLE